MQSLSRTIVFALFATLVGCGDSSPPSSATPASSSAASDTAVAEPSSEETTAPNEVAAEDTGEGGSASSAGILKGVITFKGDVPAPQTIQATKDPEFCSAGEVDVTDIVVKDGKLSGAVVELTVRGDNLPEFVTPEEGFVIRQKDCLFSPRLVVAYNGAELTVHNDDKVEHNVNTGQWNLLQSPGGEPITQKMNYGGTPFTRVTCNIHNWMESWVYIAKSPLYAASNEVGEFVIEGIPAGAKIRGTVTHATLGKQRFTVEIKAGETTEQNFEFEAK